MNEDDKKKWEDIVGIISDGNEVSLGECLVNATMIDGSFAIVISNMFGMGFDMVMPADLDDGVKEAVVSMTESSSGDPAVFGEESLKKSFVSGYINTLLPEITEDLRDMVSDIEPFKAVLSIMAYLNLLEEAMTSNDIDTVTLGPDGNIYIDADEMPFSHTEISEQIGRMSGLSDDEVALMRRWIPAASKIFDGVFPGYVCKDAGIGVEVTLISMEMSRSFSATVEDFWGNGPGEDKIIDIDTIIDMVKKSVSSSRVVSKKPVEDALSMIDLDGLSDMEKDAMRLTILNAYGKRGNIIPFVEAVPEYVNQDGIDRLSGRIIEASIEDESFPVRFIHESFSGTGGIVFLSTT